MMFLVSSSTTAELQLRWRTQGSDILHLGQRRALRLLSMLA